MKLDKSTYHNFCKIEKSLPLFFQDWYLDAVCTSNNWDVIQIEKSGKVIAVLPYYLKTKAGFNYITMPPLTKFMGPYIIETYSHKATKILKEIIELIPKVSLFHQNFHYQTDNWTPFYIEKFQQTTLYSHQITNTNNVDDVFQNLDRYYKKKVGQAKNELIILEELNISSPIETSWKLIEKTFHRQKMDVPFSHEVYKELLEKSHENNSSKIFFAENNNNEIIASAVLIWDKESAYYLIAGDDPKFRKSAAGIYLIYHMIVYSFQTLEKSTFDFLGSMIPSIAVIRQKFGAKPTSYFQIEKHNSILFKWLSKLKNR